MEVLSIIATALTETGSKMDEVILRNSKVLVIWNCN
jgi:transcription termination factor Rho